MITGVAAMLLAEAMLRWSRGLAVWAVCFFAINHLHFVFLEEPGLERRLGQACLAYHAHVPRWIPRLRPWGGAQSTSSTKGAACPPPSRAT